MKSKGLLPVAVREKYQRTRQAAAGAGNRGEYFERAKRGKSGEAIVLRDVQKMRKGEEYSGHTWRQQFAQLHNAQLCHIERITSNPEDFLLWIEGDSLSFTVRDNPRKSIRPKPVAGKSRGIKERWKESPRVP